MRYGCWKTNASRKKPQSSSAEYATGQGNLFGAAFFLAKRLRPLVRRSSADFGGFRFTEAIFSFQILDTGDMLGKPSTLGRRTLPLDEPFFQPRKDYEFTRKERRKKKKKPETSLSPGLGGGLNSCEFAPPQTRRPGDCDQPMPWNRGKDESVIITQGKADT